MNFILIKKIIITFSLIKICLPNFDDHDVDDDDDNSDGDDCDDDDDNADDCGSDDDHDCSQLPLRRTPLGPAVSVRLRAMSVS